MTIGSTVSTRSVFLKRKPVRVAISAKARPSAVVPAPQHSARNSVFQATPQRPPPDRQRRLQIFAVASRSTSSAGMKTPSPSWKACDQDAQDRPGGEQQDRGGHGRHRAGDEGVAAERAAQRQADREQRQQRDQHDRGAGADADLAAFHLAEQRVEPAGGPAAQADAEGLGGEQHESDGCDDNEQRAAPLARHGRQAEGDGRGERQQDRRQPPLGRAPATCARPDA